MTSGNHDAEVNLSVQQIFAKYSKQIIFLLSQFENKIRQYCHKLTKQNYDANTYKNNI